MSIRNELNREIMFVFFVLYTITAADASIAVIFNGLEYSQNVHDGKTRASISVDKTLFEPRKISADVDIVNIFYKDLNSTFCDLGKLLAIIDEIQGYDFVFVKFLDCQCEKILLFYLNHLNIDVTSSCRQSSTSKTMFRVPIVEYFPFVVKHSVNSVYYGCTGYSLPCYSQILNDENETVINTKDKNCCTGWTVDVLIHLSAQLNCTFLLYFQAEGLFGVYNNITNSWNGVVQDLITGKGDIAVQIAVQPDRCMVLDCSLGHLFDSFNAIVKLGLSTRKLDTHKDSIQALVKNFQIFLGPFHIDLLITVLMIFNVFLILIWATDKVCLSYRNKRAGTKKERFSLLESTSYVWATAFGRDVGDSKKPITLSARYLASWLAFLSLVFVNVYVARLMAEIVKQEPSKPFTSLQDPQILTDGLRLGVVKGSAMEAYFHKTRNTALRKSYDDNIKKNLVPSLSGGIELVKNGTLDGFIADRLSIETVLNQDPNCSLSLMGKDFSTVALGFMFRMNWSWAQQFKLEELKMNENKRFEDFWKIRPSPSFCNARQSHEHARLSVTDISGLFLVLILSFAYCSFSLVLENVHSQLKYHYQKLKEKWEVPQVPGFNDQ